MALRREITLFDAVLLIIGNVVGAGIFTTSGYLARELPDPVLFVGIWILGGALTICGALTYAELAAMLPLAGGDYQYLKAAYGRCAGYMLGWTSFWVIGPGSSAALAIALVSYLSSYICLAGPIQQKLLAIGLVAGFSLVNIRGIRPGGTTQDVITVGTLLILGTMILGGFLLGDGSWEHFTVQKTGTSWKTIFSSPMIAVIFTYSGWFASAYIGSEIRNPQRNLPLSLVLGTLVVIVLYTLMNTLYLFSMPISELENTVNVAQASLANLFSPDLAEFVSIPIILAIAASINANILTGARVCYAMADDQVIWAGFRRLHPLYNTPYIAIIAQSVLAALLVLFGTFNELLGYVVFVMILTSVATGLSLFVLRYRHPQLPRPYRTWGYPVVPIFFILTYTIIAVQIAVANPKTSFLGIGIAVSGLPFFYYRKKRCTQSHRSI